MNEFPAAIGDQWRVIRILGRGGEGIVYLVEDRATSQRWVWKSYHDPVPAAWLPGLAAYQGSVLAPDCPGLPPITLVQHQDKVLGVRYPYVALYRVHRRILRSIGQVGQALVGAYCQMQHYLMSRHRLSLYDADPVNFMLARDGQFYWTDFGYGVAALDHPSYMKCGLLEYGFATLLLGIHDVNFKLLAQPLESYTYHGPCAYLMNPALDDIASKHPWVRKILEAARG